MLITISSFSSASAFCPTLIQKMPNQKDVFTTKPHTRTRRVVDLSSYAPNPQEYEFSIEAVEFYSEFEDYVQFDDEFPLQDRLLAEEGDNAAHRMLQRQRKSRHERADRRARASARLAGRSMRSSPDALRLVAGAMSDFVTLLGFGLLNAATPLTLDSTSVDNIRFAVYSAFNNATTDALGRAQPWSNAVNRQELTIFVLRNAVAPAILHRVASIVADNAITDAKLAEQVLFEDITIIYLESHNILAHIANLVATTYNFQ